VKNPKTKSRKIKMSDYYSHEEMEKQLHIIVKKVQEGKTFICLEYIKRSPDEIHLIVTMNTIKSNLQFFERASDNFGGGNICVFNSKETKTDAKKYNHAKDVLGVKHQIEKSGVDIIIMCGHPTRFKTSIIELIEELSDSRSFSKKIIIHIDEAHEYIPRYRPQIVQMNNYDIVNRIVGYSATSIPIWVNKTAKSEFNLFKDLYIVDVEEQFGIMSTPGYVGVKDCIFPVLNGTVELIDEHIPHEFVERWGTLKNKEDEKEKDDLLWYTENNPFLWGNELNMLSYVNHFLNNNNIINNDEFSYNFIPGYVRVLTHDYIMTLILSRYEDAIVFIINGKGKGTNYYFTKDNKSQEIIQQIVPPNNEPANQIYEVVKKNQNRPVFITGFLSVGMSVTFINEDIGNFDNVVFSHQHYLSQPHILYQLCRFCFNPIKWVDKSKIKKTNVYAQHRSVIDSVLEYEAIDDNIQTNLKGSLCSLEEVKGNLQYKEKRVPQQLKYDCLKPYIIRHKSIIQSVQDEEDEERARVKIMTSYKEFMGHEPKECSIPKKNPSGFYECSKSGKIGILTDVEKEKSWLKTCTWSSNIQITETQKKYARIYIVYETKDDPTEYSWMLRRVEIKDCEEVKNFFINLNK